MLREAARLFLTLGLAAASLVAPPLASNEASDAPRLLAQASSWTYQLQNVDTAELAKTRYDIIVLDMASAGGKSGIERLRKKPGGGRRLLLSYLSVGEAEVYRYYWAICCAGGKRPSWLGAENPRWKGNFSVEYWEDDWKAIIFEDAMSYVRRIIDAGFDGVVLDRIDAHAAVKTQGVDGKAEMIRFVQELSAKAKSLKPGFLVLAQNGEALLADETYLAAIDGIAKEDLLFGTGADAKRNAPAQAAASTDALRRASERGKPVMVIEYLQKPEDMAAARTEIMELGFVPTFAPRTLQKLQVENLEDDGSH